MPERPVLGRSGRPPAPIAHPDLDGLDEADQHPVEAISGLIDWLEAVLVAGSNVTITEGNGTLVIASSGGGGGDFQTVGPFDLLEGGGTLTGVPRHVAVSGSGGDLPGPVSVTMPSAPADPDGAWTVSYGAFDDASLDELDVVGALNLSVIPRGYTAVLTPVPGVGWFCDGLFPTATVPTGGGAVDSVNGETGVVVLDAADVGAVDGALVGAPDGVAELDSGGLVPSSQLPSYVDDVIEAANFAALPGTGATGKIYVTLDNNLTFRWSGSAYAEISASLALGETSSTAYRGDRGKTAYDHSQVTTGNPHGTTAGDITSGTFDAARIPDLDAAKITSGTVAQARLGSGSAGAGTKFLADDQTYKTVSSGIADPGGSNDDFLQRKAGAWTHRTVAQVKADLNLPVITTAVAGFTYGMGGVVASDSTYLNGLNKWWGCLCYLPAGSYDRVIFNVATTGASTWSMGIYPLNPATGLVDHGAAPLHNIGNVDLSLATGAISVTTSFTLSTPRLVWIGGSVSAYTATATVRGAGGSDAAVTRLIGAPLGGTIAGSVPNGGLATGVRVVAGTGAAGVNNFPSGGEFASSGPKIQVRAA